MTFRSKTTIKRSHRPAYESDHRRNLLLTLGFGAVVLLALLILGGAAVASWYGDHLEPLAKVNGQSITKDDFRDRARVESFRLDYLEAQVRARMLSGRLDSAAGQSQISSIGTARTNIDNTVIEDLVNSSLEAQLATQQNVTVTDQQIDAQLTKQSTTPETRHLWVIGVKPAVTAPATDPTDQQKADAKAKADKALADLKAGTAWADVAKQLTDDVYSSKGGEVGWVAKGNNVLDATLETALFALPVNGITDVITSADGLYRIGRVTDIDAEAVDQAYTQKIKDAGVSIDSFRKAARADALKAALNDKLVADVVDQATPQRHVAEIFLSNAAASQGTGTGDEVQVRHILFSPNHDPQAAAALPATDPAWKAAEQEADNAYAAVTRDPTQFPAIAMASSDDAGTKGGGGLLPYYTKAALDKAFASAIFVDGLVKDQILLPVRSSFGWHVIQFLDRRKQPADRMTDIKAQADAPGADFAALAKANSEATTKDQGGDVGWIAKNQLDSVREIAIFKAPVGGLTDIITTADGIYLYKILAEETRKPDPAQIDTLKASAFDNWFTSQKNFAHIERLYTTSGAAIPPVQ